MLPPFANEHGQNKNHQVHALMAHHNCHLYCQLHHMNPQMHHSTKKSFQNKLTTQPITQPPQQGFMGRKTIVEKAQAVIN